MLNATDSTAARRLRAEIFGNFTPDQPDLESQGLTFVQNAVPLATGRYGPIRGLVADSSNTMASVAPAVDRAIGTIGSYRNMLNGDVTCFVLGFQPATGTAKLLAYNERTRLWSDVTRASADYKFSLTRHGRFAAFGEDMFALVGRGEALQVIKVGEENTFTDVPNAPKAADLATVRDFLVVANFQHKSLNLPDGVMWSASGNARNWPNPGTLEAFQVLSGAAQLPGGGRIQRIMPGIGGADAIIIAESRIFRMTFVGPPTVWQFDVADYDQGTSIPGSVASNNETLFFIGRDGFMAFNGSQSFPIGAGQVDESFFTDSVLGVNTSPGFGFQNAVTATCDTNNKTYMVSYRTNRPPSTFNITTESGDQITAENGDRLIATVDAANNNAIFLHNYRAGHWGHAYLEVDAFNLVETERTELDTPRLVAIGRDLNMSLLTGDTLEAVFEGPERLANAAQRETIFKILPGTDATTVTANLKIRDRLSDGLTTTTARGIENDGMIPVNFDGATARFWRLVLTIPADTEWTHSLGATLIMSDWGQGGLS